MSADGGAKGSEPHHPADAPGPDSIGMQRRTPRISYQFRALSRKSLSYQKRQMFTNIACISLCPLLMVLISALLGSVLQSVITKSATGIELLFCSNEMVSDPITNIPISDVNLLAFFGKGNYTGPAIAAASYETGAVRHANFITAGTSGAGGVIGVQPCERWMGNPSRAPLSRPYDVGLLPGIPDVFTRDTTFRNQPTTGWLGALVQPALAPLLVTYQSLPWAYVYTPPALRSLVGAKPATNYSVSVGVSGLSLAVSVDPSASTAPSLPAPFGPANQATDSGLLALSSNRFYLANSSLPISPALAAASTSPAALLAYLSANPVRGIRLRSAPFFVDLSADADAATAPGGTYAKEKESRGVDKAIDDTIGAVLISTVYQLANLDKTPLNGAGATLASQLRYLGEATSIAAAVPAAALKFDKLNFSSLEWGITVQAGTDRRVASASALPPLWFRRISMAAEVSNMILRNIGAIPSSVSFANATIAQGFRHFPSYINTKSAAQLPIASFIGRILYPWGVSFLIPIFVVAIVKEKEARVEVMMEMNGLKRSTYFLTQYIQYLVLALASAIVFIVAGTALRMDMFTTTGKAVLPILFFIWANVQVSLAFFFGSFFSKSRSALIMSFLVILCSVVVALAIDALYSGNLNPVFFIWPPFAFYRSLTRINNASWRRSLRPYELSSLAFPDEVGVAMVFMVVEIPVYLLLSYYLGKVLPSEYGVRRPFWFPVTDAINFFQSRSTSRSPGGSGSLSRKDIAIVTPEHEQPQSSAPLHRSTSSHLVTIPEEDDDVRDERKRIEAGEYDPTRTPLVIKGMRKVYEGRMGKGAKVAVKNITVAAEAGKVFGLLGPNGAGKTTLISILTGIYPPTSGEAIIAGYNISTNMAEVHRNIGICPQHDILWDDLTVEEHLLFYARLKGVPAQDESKAVAESMKAVALEKFAGRLSKGLSGGEKRRLSIAIALVGDPACVFLDEPTTGLDPEVRRMIWDIIVKARKHKTIILTTHSMEEAEVLCSRIGIMAKGTMRCLGSVLRLKQLYGAGFKLTLSAAAEDMRRASGYVESLLPSGAYERIDSFQTSAAYEFKPSPGLVGQLFEILQRDSKANGITDWGISETSLEEVFLEIITDEDASAD